jgi:hypothetical protein
MDLVEKIVKVNITRQTTVPSMKSFSGHLVADMFNPAGITPAFDAEHRVRLFGSLDEVAEAGFPTNGFVYRAAAKQFSQSPHISELYVGIKLASDASWTDALTAIKNNSNLFYAITASARDMASQQEIAQWAEANEKLYCAGSGDSTIVDEETGDIAAWAKLNVLDRTIPFYHPDSALVGGQLSDIDPIQEAALFGLMLTKHPGSPTWKFKTLKSVPTFDLTGGQYATAMAKNAFVYNLAADVPITSEGKVASGEYIDVIHGCDWLKARIQNLVFTVLSQNDKVPFTDAGIQLVVSALRAALDEGVRYEILASYEISAPTAAEVAIDQKGKRNLPDITFTAPLAGAIHSTEINGTITL